MPTIHTTRYSKVVSAFIDRYPDAEAKLDKQKPDGQLKSWCTNAALLKAIDFSLRRGQVELLGFHDGPQNMWASTESMPLVEELANKQVLRYVKRSAQPPSLFARLFGRHHGASS